MKTTGLALAIIVGMFACMAALIALNGVMLSYLWQWFVVPFGAPSIGIPHAIGLAVLVSMVTHEGTPKSDKEDAWERLFTSLFAKVVAFGIAFGLSFLLPA